MSWITTYRKISISWRLRRTQVSMFVSIFDSLNYKFEGNELLIYDYGDGNFYPVGLDTGQFVTLSGSGTNYEIQGGVLKLLDINDGLFYNIYLEEGGLVVIDESEINHKIENNLTLKLMDISNGYFYKIGIQNGALVVLY